MTRIRTFLGGAAVAALLVVALPTAGASAAPKLLVFSEAGSAVSTGAPAKLGVSLAGCYVYASGTVTANGATKVKLLAGSSAPASECYEGLSSSGELTEMQWGSNGKVTMKGKVTISKPGPCVYTYSKWKGEFAIPGSAYIEAATEGKISKKVSSKTCAATDVEEFAAVALAPSNEAFEEALKS